MAEQKSIFRKKSLERIESPESLDQYLRVTTPGTWAFLISLIIFLVGIVFWGSFGTLTSTIQTAVISRENQTYCLVPENSISQVIEDRKIQINDKEYELKPGTINPLTISEEVDQYTRAAGNLKIGDVVYPVSVDAKLEDGIYSGTIVTETIHPIQLLTN
ncbi:MAG: hypothetical protein KBT48_11070 [Firmicutes bacterium]|nr:hypothetical protein [Bacillota bacterium]